MRFRLENGPCTFHTLDDIYRSRQGANKALRWFLDNGHAEVIGKENFKGEGGNAYVYAAAGGPRWKKHQLKHDVIAFRVIVRLGVGFLNGDDVDPELVPDFQLFSESKGRWVFGEVCSGASPYGRICEERYPKYEGCPHPVLWVSCGLWGTNDVSRMEGLRRRAKMPHLWFCTLQDVLDRGLQTELINCERAAVALTDLLTDPEPPSTARTRVRQGKNGKHEVGGAQAHS